MKAGTSRTAVASGVIASVEYELREARRCYIPYLSRAASQAEVSRWVARMHGGATEERCLATVIGSPEYLARVNG